MDNIKITTLTPTRIGSGEVYQQNFEFVKSLENDDKLVLINQEKVLDVIGFENVHHWTSAIENGEALTAYLHTRNKALKSNDIAARFIQIQNENNPTRKPIKDVLAQLMSGNSPLLPGSSLKGSIRTALLNFYVMNDGDWFYENRKNLLSRRGRFDDGMIMKKHFGNDPNHEITRLLRVGDSRFETETVCSQARSVNLKNDWGMDGDLDQYIEYIPPERTTSCRISFNEFLDKQAKKVTLKRRVFGRERKVEHYKLYSKYNTDDLRLPNLFDIINQHTAILLDDELKFWENQRRIPDEIDNYCEIMNDLLTQVDQLIEEEAKNTCILRVGWGTGFLNMTGGWQEKKLTNQDYENLLKEIRPRISQRTMMPKTRRMLYDGTPLGFVKLTLQN